MQMLGYPTSSTVRISFALDHPRTNSAFKSLEIHVVEKILANLLESDESFFRVYDRSFTHTVFKQMSLAARQPKTHGASLPGTPPPVVSPELRGSATTDSIPPGHGAGEMDIITPVGAVVRAGSQIRKQSSLATFAFI